MMPAIDVFSVRIVEDADYPDKVEIHMLDELGEIVEGGQFDKAAFMQSVLEFYNKNY